MNTEMTFVVDSGHGWLKVDLDDYPDADRYSTGYAYTDGTHVYLEEDLEASAFMGDHGVDVTLRYEHHDGDCYVRGLARVPEYMDYDTSVSKAKKYWETLERN